jgi:galactose-1-phosphate uridylyltransferase
VTITIWKILQKFSVREFQVNGVENKRILELKKENKRLVAKNKELEEKLEKTNSIVMAYTNELQTREVIKGVWETQCLPNIHGAS